MPTNLELALEINRRVSARAARETREIPEGLAVLDSEMASVYNLNHLILFAPACRELTGQGLVALSDRWMGHLPHRSVRLEDPEAGERLASELRDTGFERVRTVLMVSSSPNLAAEPDPRTRPLSEAELDAMTLAFFSQSDNPHYFEGLAERLVAVQARMRAGTSGRGFGAGENGGLQCMCTLFLDEDVYGYRVAMLDRLATLQGYRGLGLSRAVMDATLSSAQAWGPDLMVLNADAEDWPRRFYANLGFTPVGGHVTLLRGPSESRRVDP